MTPNLYLTRTECCATRFLRLDSPEIMVEVAPSFSHARLVLLLISLTPDQGAKSALLVVTTQTLRLLSATVARGVQMARLFTKIRHLEKVTLTAVLVLKGRIHIRLLDFGHVTV